MVSVSWPNWHQAVTTLVISLSSGVYTDVHLGKTSFAFNIHLKWPVKRISFSKAPLSFICASTYCTLYSIGSNVRYHARDKEF